MINKNAEYSLKSVRLFLVFGLVDPCDELVVEERDNFGKEGS